METKLEHLLVNSYKKDLISYIKSHPESFNELIKLAIADKDNYSWRASWMIWSVMKENDERIQPYLDKIIEVLPTKKDNQKRELLIMLQKMKLNENLEGKLFDICVTIWEKTDKQVSLRYNAFKLMIKIIKKHPTLCKEIELYTEPLYTDSLNTFVKKMVSELKKG